METYPLVYMVVTANSRSFMPSASKFWTDMNGWSDGHMFRLGSSLFRN